MNRMESTILVPIDKQNLVLSNQEATYTEFIDLLKLNNIKMSKAMFLKFLRDHKMVHDKKGKFYNFPTAFTLEMGIMLLTSHIKGKKNKYVPKITINGQKYLIEKFHYMLADEIPVTLDWYLNRDILGNPRFDYFGNQGTSISPLYVIKYGEDERIKALKQEEAE
uniref:phage antirepressor KilAC domain-containing protein n=1 Tax=Bacteroides acidifaciens TaxID=85831 RepID=UPI0025B27AFE|nr:phage antirepressor KilAC domain-containing protein [Bacteroides acidifaciens]